MSCTTDANEEWDAARVCPEDKRGVFTDSRDGREYKYTTIGNQVWMAENLNFLSKSSECFEKARKARRFEKTFSCKIDESVYEVMADELRKETENS